MLVVRLCQQEYVHALCISDWMPCRLRFRYPPECVTAPRLWIDQGFLGNAASVCRRVLGPSLCSDTVIRDTSSHQSYATMHGPLTAPSNISHCLVKAHNLSDPDFTQLFPEFRSPQQRCPALLLHVLLWKDSASAHVLHVACSI